MYDLFSHFTINEWIYESNKIHEFEKIMTPQEREIFYLDPKNFTWIEATHLYGYGVERYMNKIDVIIPDGKSTLLLHHNKFRYFDDARRAFLDFDIISANPTKIRKDTILSKFVTDHIENEMQKLKQSDDR